MTTEVNRLIYNRLVVVVVSIYLLYNVRSTGGMHDASECQLDIAELGAGPLNFPAVVSLVEVDHVSVF